MFEHKYFFYFAFSSAARNGHKIFLLHCSRWNIGNGFDYRFCVKKKRPSGSLVGSPVSPIDLLNFKQMWMTLSSYYNFPYEESHSFELAKELFFEMIIHDALRGALIDSNLKTITLNEGKIDQNKNILQEANHELLRSNKSSDFDSSCWVVPSHGISILSNFVGPINSEPVCLHNGRWLDDGGQFFKGYLGSCEIYDMCESGVFAANQPDYGLGYIFGKESILFPYLVNNKVNHPSIVYPDYQSPINMGSAYLAWKVGCIIDFDNVVHVKAA
jgi:hypothetical protein